MCVRTSFSPAFQDAWPAPVVGARNESVIHMEIPTLFADSLNYCTEDDSECDACLQDVKSTSAVCYGASDCVCLGACAAEAWDATAELLLPVLFIDEPFNSTDCVGEVSSEDASVAIDSDQVNGSSQDTATSNNECMWTTQEGAGGSCGTLRSCYDCLNTPLASGTVASSLMSKCPARSHTDWPCSSCLARNAPSRRRDCAPPWTRTSSQATIA
jgi:hypothetical protein